MRALTVWAIAYALAGLVMVIGDSLQPAWRRPFYLGHPSKMPLAAVAWPVTTSMSLLMAISRRTWRERLAQGWRPVTPTLVFVALGVIGSAAFSN